MMRKYLFFVMVVLAVILSFYALADEVSEKTDSSFVGSKPPATVNSAFMGDDSNSVDNNAFRGQNSYFAGENSDKAEDAATINSFVGDGAFVGNSYGRS